MSSENSGWQLNTKKYIVNTSLNFVGYKEKTAKNYKCVHSLVGCIVKEGPPEKKGKETLYPFTLSFSNGKSKKYYALHKEHVQKWVYALKKNTNSSIISDYYEIKVR